MTVTIPNITVDPHVLLSLSYHNHLHHAVSVSGLTFLLTLLSVWMTTMRISYGHTLLTAYMHVLILLAIIVSSRLRIKRLVDQWKHPRQVQEEYLRAILKRNKDTAYAKEHGLTTVTQLKELREKHTLTDYERYRPYVDRMARGEGGLLTQDPLIRFALTSGTLGRVKKMPYTKYFYSSMAGSFITLTADTLIRSFGLKSFLQQEVFLYTDPKLRYSDGGTLMGPASLLPSWVKPILVMYSSPRAAFVIGDPVDSVYVHLLFGLRDRNLRAFGAGFTSNLMSAMRQLEECWSDIVRDIEEGTVSTKNVPADIHDQLVRALGGGDRERSLELRKDFEKGFDGIMKRVWPFLERVQAIDSTGIKEVLLNYYVKGENKTI